MKKIFSLLLSAAALTMPALTASADKVGEVWTLPGEYTFALGDEWGDPTGDEVNVKIISRGGNQYTIQDVDQTTFPSSISFTFDESTNKLTFNGGSDTAFGSTSSVFYPAISDWGWVLKDSFSNVVFNPATGAIDFRPGWDIFGFVWTTTGNANGISTGFTIASAQQKEPEAVVENFTIDGTYELSISDAWDTESTSVIKVKITGSDGNYTITEVGTNKFATEVPFTYNNYKLTFAKTTGLGAEANTTFYPCINDGYGPEQQSPYSDVTFNPATGEIDFQSALRWGSFCFAWAEGDGMFPNFTAGYKINSAVQVEEELEPEWNDVGNAIFVDGWVLPMLGINQMEKENQYEVLLQQNRDNENLYRLVNPYAAGPAAEHNIHSTKQGFIEFDITDPEHVLFNKVAAGFAYDDPRDGAKKFKEFYCMNYLGYYHLQYPSMSLEQLTSPAYSRMMCYTTFADGVVTLNFLDDDGRKTYDAHYGTDDTSQRSQNCGNYWTYEVDWVDYPCDMTARIYFPGFTPEEPEPEVELLELEGNMTYQVDMNAGYYYPDLDLLDAEEIEVVAKFNEETNELTIAPFADANNPITFTIDLATGAATAADQVSTVEDLGEDGELTYYFSSVANQETTVTAQIYNADDKTHIYVEDWGEGMDFPGSGFFFMAANFNTVVVLDGNIPGLEADLPEEPEVELLELEGNMIYQLDMNMGSNLEDLDLLDAVEIEVVATFNEATNELTIAPFAEYDSITLTLDLATGAAKAEEQIAYSEEGFDYYFTTLQNEEYELIAAVYTAGSKTYVNLAPWGEATYYPGYGMIFNTAFFNNFIVLDGTIPGLEATADEVILEVRDVKHSLVEQDGGWYVAFDVTVGADALTADDEITLFVKGPGNDDFQAIETGEGEASELAKVVAEGKETVISFNVGSLEREKDYEVSMYAKSGLHKSEVFTMEFSSITAGVENVAVDAAAVRYFNLQGVEVTEPAAGTTVIKVQGNQATKVLVK